MGTRYIVGDLYSGRRIVNLPVISGSWSDPLDTAEDISATVSLNNEVVRGLNLRNSATVAKTFLAAVDTGAFGQDGRVLAAGQMNTPSYDRDARTLTLTAKGLLDYFTNSRFILPLAALTALTSTFVIPDPSDTSGVATIPNPALATTYSNMSLGSIGVSLVAQAMTWPGGNLPIILPSIEHDTDPTHTRTYDAVNFKTVGSALTDLMGVLGGPEINFAPEFTADGLGIQWVMQVGTNEDPLIHSDTVTAWNVTAAQSPVSGLKIDGDGSGMASIYWATGGSAANVALTSRAVDMTLVNAGFPLMESIDTTHTDVVIQATLDSYSMADLVGARTISETWSFDVVAHPIDDSGNAAGPQLGAFSTGDFIILHIDPYNDETNRGDLYIPEGGNFPLRITGISGDQDGIVVSISAQPVIVSS